jgi:SacI restriction endonuclease
VTIAIEEAARVFRAEAEGAATLGLDPVWVERIERLSFLCLEGASATHIAFLGTSILAKSVDSSVDLFAIKPTHAVDNSNAYSARRLCDKVLVPLAAELGVNIGVTGREPLNNQPYFRMTHLGDGTPVRANARPAFDFMVSLVTELQQYTAAQARVALRAYIAVRRRFQVVYATHGGAVSVTWANLASTIERFVVENSEGGKRAQAVVAGMLDVVAGPDRVESGRINDPSRHYPGDVAVRGLNGNWEKAIEVRDKLVQESDVYLFGQNCLNRGVRDAAIVLASANQHQLDATAIATWAANLGLGMTIFYGWAHFVDQVLWWAGTPKAEGAAEAVRYIESRLIAVEASPEAVRSWHALTLAN